MSTAACGADTVAGSPTIESSDVGQPAFDPCTIPDEALRAVGVDPATEDPDIFGVQATGWEVCKWTGDWFGLSVFSTTQPIDEIKTNPRNTEFTPVGIGTRGAITYRETSDTRRENCDVAFGIEDGSVMVRIHGMVSRPALREPCEMAVLTATTLDPHLPR
ncbi:DUF3558 domain-containing protein [Rhodococcus sp. NPDC058514]|uniref:DUF3558 domain-containing protein n=1 Tax=unclassified Rhodococcus (in: high G+C Gram-positive bacteria) TaxID=192944 RepID=UPI00364EA5FC